MENNSDFQHGHAPQGQVMKILQGGFKKGMWQSDREAYSDEEIEAWNNRLRKLSQKHPWLEEFILYIKPKQKLQIVQSVAYPKISAAGKTFVLIADYFAISSTE